MDELNALLALASEGSFVRAALVLQRHPTVISKRILSLEKRLGVRLVERTTRAVRLTEAGVNLAARIRSATETISEAEQTAAAGGLELRGQLRISLPAALGRQWLAQEMPDFAETHPGLDIEIDYSERYVDLVAEGFDVAVRVGSLADSRLVARKLCDHQIVLGASPAYLNHHGVPRSPRELIEHNLLRYIGPVKTREWRMSNGRVRETILPTGRFGSNDIDALLEAARQGAGIVGFGEWSMARDFAAGTLRRVLPDWGFQDVEGIYLVRPSGQFTSARTQAFIAWISAKFSGGPPWRRSILS